MTQTDYPIRDLDFIEGLQARDRDRYDPFQLFFDSTGDLLRQTADHNSPRFENYGLAKMVVKITFLGVSIGATQGGYQWRVTQGGYQWRGTQGG